MHSKQFNHMSFQQDTVRLPLHAEQPGVVRDAVDDMFSVSGTRPFPA